MRNKDKPWFNDDCRCAFDLKQEAHLRWTRYRSRVNCGESVHYQRRANVVYAQAMRQFSVKNRDVLMNDQCPYKWWSTLKSAMFGSSSDSSLPPLIGAGGGLICESVEEAEMLSAHFDGKQSRDLVDLPSTFHPSPSLTTFAIRSREVKRLLLDMDFYDGTDPLSMSPLFRRGRLRLWPLVSLWYFGGSFVWVALMFAGEWLMSPQFQRVYHPPKYPIIDQFP